MQNPRSKTWWQNDGKCTGNGARTGTKICKNWPLHLQNWQNLRKQEVKKNVNVTIRALKYLNSAPVQITSRTCNAIIHLMFHGWPTRSRCGVQRHRCLMCSMEQGDCPNHIIRCPFSRRAFAAYGVWRWEAYKPEVFLLCDFPSQSGSELYYECIDRYINYRIVY